MENFFSRFIGKGVVIDFRNGERAKVGVLKDYTKPWLLLSSRGRESTIHEDHVAGIREALGEVEP